jgi:hypothetical protein
MPLRSLSVWKYNRLDSREIDGGTEYQPRQMDGGTEY